MLLTGLKNSFQNEISGQVYSGELLLIVIGLFFMAYYGVFPVLQFTVDLERSISHPAGPLVNVNDSKHICLIGSFDINTLAPGTIGSEDHVNLST